ncbi:MAG: Imm1 family immunity protein [Hyphomicrobium sp.]
MYFDKFWGDFWPSLKELEPYFLAPTGKEWFYTGGNDSGGLDLFGLDGTEHLPRFQGRVDIKLSMWGNPNLGVLLIYEKVGGGHMEAYSSKGDMRRIREWVRSLHSTPLPAGLFIPFDRAWLAVKEFMETEGQLPTSIEWVKGADLPENTFPDPTVRLPGEE